MADSSGDSNQSKEAPLKKGTSQLENLSQEDLVKQCKRQLMFLQKAKAKSDDLVKQVSQLEKENQTLLATSKSASEAKEQCHELESKLSTVQEELASERETRKQAEVKGRESAEQLQCNDMKLSTLQQTCQFLQVELQSLEENRKEMNQQIEILIQARDSALDSLKSMKEKWNDERNSFNIKIAELQTSQGHFKEESEDNTNELNNLKDSIRLLKEQWDIERFLLDEQLGKAKEEKRYWESKFEELNYAFSSRKEEWYNERSNLDGQLVKTTEEKVLHELKVEELSSTLNTSRQQWNEKESALNEKLTEWEIKFNTTKDEEIQLNLKVEELNSILDSCKDQWKEERSVLDNQLSELENQLDKIKEEKESLQIIFEEQKCTVDNCKLQWNEDKSILEKQWNEEKSILEKQLEELERRLSEEREENDGKHQPIVDNHVVELEVQLLQFKEEEKQVVEELNRLKEERAIVDNQLLELESKYFKFEEENKALEHRIEDLTASFNTSKQQWDEAQSVLENQKTDLENTVSDLHSAIDSLKAEHSTLISCSEEEKNLLESLNERNNHLEKVIETEKATFTSLTEVLEMEKLQLIRDIKDQQDMDSNGEQLLRERNELVDHLTKENRALEDKLNELTACIDSKVDSDVHTDDVRWDELRDNSEEQHSMLQSESDETKLESSDVYHGSTQTEDDSYLIVVQKELEIQVLTADNEVLKRRLDELVNNGSNSVDGVTQQDSAHKDLIEQNETLQSLKQELSLQQKQISEYKSICETIESSDMPIQGGKFDNLTDACNSNTDEAAVSAWNETVLLDPDIKVNQESDLIIELETLKQEKLQLEEKLQSYEDRQKCSSSSEDFLFSEEDRRAVSILQNQLTDALHSLQSMTQELRISQDHRDQVTLELEQVRELEHFLEEEVTSLREECKCLAQNVSRLEVDAENDVLHVGRLEDELRAMEDREGHIRRVLLQGQEEQTALGKELADKRSEVEILTGVVKELRQVSHDKVLELTGLQSTIDTLEYELNISKADLEESRNVNSVLEVNIQEYVGLEVRLSSVSMTLEKNRQLLMVLEEENTIKTSHILHLEKEINNLQVASTNADERVNQDLGLFDDLQKQILQKSERIVLLEKECENVNTLVSKLQEKLRHSAVEKESVQQSFAELQEESNTKDVRLSLLEVQIEEKQFVIMDLEETIKIATAEKQNIELLKLEIQEKENLLQSLQKEVNHLKVNVSNLEEQLKMSSISFEELENKVSSKEEQICLLQEQNRKSELRVVELQQQLNDPIADVFQIPSIDDEISAVQVIDTENIFQTVVKLQNNTFDKRLIENENLQQGGNEQLASEIEHWKSIAAANSVDQCEGLQKELSEKTELISRMDKQLEDLKNKVEQLEERLRSAPAVLSPEQLQQESGNKLRMDKLKVVAVKLKKELAETKKELVDLKSGKEELLLQRDELSTSSRQHLMNFQSLQVENDRLQDECETRRTAFVQLEFDVTKLVSELTTCKEQLAEGKQEISQLRGALEAAEQEKKRLEAGRMEIQSQLIVRRSERETEQKKTEAIRMDVKHWETKCQSLEKDLKDKDQQLKDLQGRLDQLSVELEQGRVLSLELGAYERSMEDIKAQLDQKSSLVEELNGQLADRDQEKEGLRREIGHLEHQCLSEEGRSAHLKDSLETTRTQLAAKAQAESELASLLANVKHQKEEVVYAKEELQCQLAEVSGRLSALERELRLSRDQSEKLTITLKGRISALDSELETAYQLLEASREEFNSYKVRVHSVLKQQKSSRSPTESSPSVVEQEQRDQLERALDLCKGKMAQMSEELSLLSLERDSLLREQERLHARQAALTRELQDKEESWTLRLQESTHEYNSSRLLWESEKQQLLLHHQVLAQDYNGRISDKEAEHEQQLLSLEGQLERLQKNALQSPVQPTSDHSGQHQQQHQRQSSLPPVFDWSPTSLRGPTTDDSFDILNQERQEGEGSECTDVPQSATFKSLVTVPVAGFMPLDRLLQSEPNTVAAWNQDPELLISNITTLHKKVDHLAELLNESEASNLRLSEQTRVLKEEIRRLERNKERQEQDANLEYLKNVLLKFSTLPPSSERERLVPVLSTLLKLSQEEQGQMMAVAGRGDPNVQDPSGWGSYLHRWSGLV